MARHTPDPIRGSLGVTIIEPVGGFGGMDAYDHGLASGLSEAGVDVTLHTSEMPQTPDRPYQLALSYAGVFGNGSRARRLLRFLRGTIRAIGAARTNGHQVIHLHFFAVGLLEVFNILAARFAGQAVVVTIHDVEVLGGATSPRVFRWLAYRLADALVVHNRASDSALRAAGVPPRTAVVVVPMGHLPATTPTLLPRTEACRDLSVAAEDEVILFFGQIKPTKGLELLIEAMPAVLRERPHARLVIAGRPWRTDFTRYADQIRSLGIADRCTTRIQFIQPDELARLLSAADVLVLPYRKIYQSGVILLAMAAKRAIVVSDLAAMREVIQDGETGWLFRREDPMALAETLTQALADPVERTRRATNAERWVREHADWHSIGRETAMLFRSLGARAHH